MKVGSVSAALYLGNLVNRFSGSLNLISFLNFTMRFFSLSFSFIIPSLHTLCTIIYDHRVESDAADRILPTQDGNTLNVGTA